MPELPGGMRVLDVGLDLVLRDLVDGRTGPGTDSGADCGGGQQRGREDQTDDGAAHRSDGRSDPDVVSVVLDVDLPVLVPTDQHQALDRDDVVLRELLDSVPVLLGGVGVGVHRYVEIERCLIVGHLVSPPRSWATVWWSANSRAAIATVNTHCEASDKATNVTAAVACLSMPRMDDSYRTVEIHALAGDSAHIRVWVGVFDSEPPDRLEWLLDGIPVRDEDVVTKRPLELARSGAPEIVSRTGVFDLEVAGARKAYDVMANAVWDVGRRIETSNVLSTWALPDSVPAGLGETFNVLLVSCFFEPKDGGIGDLVASHLNGPNRPDLVLTVGDQVYLDNPWAEVIPLDRNRIREELRTQVPRRTGKAPVTRTSSAPVRSASVPDDHEYWNNYPQPGIIWPMTNFGSVGRDNWERAARSMFDAFQLAEPDRYSYELDVEPLSFFIMDNRTFRERDTIFVEARTLRPPDLLLFEDWVDRVINSDTLLPILVTGPSLFQPPKRFGEKELDRNISNYADYPAIMEGLMKLSSHGRPPLTLTGDVHYGRVISAIHATGNPARTWSKLYEVISSPSALVAGPDKPAKDARQPVHGRRDRLDAALFHDVANRFEADGRSRGAAQVRTDPDRRQSRHHVLDGASTRPSSGRNPPSAADLAPALPRFDNRLGV